MTAAEPANAPSRRWTTRELLRWMTEHFRQRQVDSPRVCADMLLGHVLGCERMRLYMEADRPASPTELTALRALVARAARHEPVQHLVGHAWFFTRRFEVDRSTMIPRPCTERLVELALESLRARTHQRPIDGAPTDFESGDADGGGPAPRILDLCTGTGCIAISLAAQLPGATVVATDVAPDALALARRNAEAHRVAERIEFREGSLWETVTVDERFDVICANPPYIPDAEWPDVAPNVRDWEPARALRGGADGLDFVRPIAEGAPRHLAPSGTLLIEIASCTAEAVCRLLAAVGLPGTVLPDHDGLLRVARALRRPAAPSAAEA
ncbi:MAG TPA: peptide chain release factor N(5)-glutamine methyltransferase [Phycisphaerales bacterium]|nr:peptide chain release factor N(5)-glutamine methyltransferase [Phycisphaerales bacterium]HMP38416.1 peptide chain release factor N(5)-glutamine methyltransferase [Phycisphaerales bacterium]